MIRLLIITKTTPFLIMFTSTHFYSRPINPNELPYAKVGESLDDRVTTFVGNFFHYRLSIFLHRVEKIHGLKAEKICLKGSIVPIILQLCDEPVGGINDNDIQITFSKKIEEEEEEEENAQNAAERYIDTETIGAVHKMALEWLQISKNEGSRPPLCRPIWGFSNIQLRNPSASRSSLIDLSLKFRQPNAIHQPDAISTKDGLEIKVNYEKNGAVNFEVAQSEYISKFSSLNNSIGLYKQHLFTVPLDHMAGIHNGLLILLRYEMKNWTFVTKSHPDDPDCEIYEKGDMEALKHLCFMQFLNEYRDGLNDMKLAQVLNNFINNHMPHNSKQAALLLRKVHSLTLKYAKEPNADRVVADKIITNLESCLEYSTAIDRQEPKINQLKEILQKSHESIRKLERERDIKAAQNLDEASQLNDKNPPVAGIEIPPPFAHEVEPENKNQDDVREEKLEKKHRLSHIETLIEFVEQAPHCQNASIIELTEWLIHLLYKSHQESFEKPFKITLESHINKLLSRLKQSETEELSIKLALAFINFINHHHDLEQACTRSRSSVFITDYILKVLSKSGKKKGKQQLKMVCNLYRSLPKANHDICLDAICTDYAKYHEIMGEHKARILLQWIMCHTGMFTIAMLKTAEAALNLMPEEMREIFAKRTANKAADLETKTLWNQICMPELKISIQKPPSTIASTSSSSSSSSAVFNSSPLYNLKDLQTLHILLNHIQDLIHSKKWIKALTQLNKLEKKLAQVNISNQDHKTVQAAIRRCKKTISEKFSDELEDEALAHPQKVFPLFERYCCENGNELNLSTYMMLVSQYAIDGYYHLSFLYAFKSLNMILHQRSIDPFTHAPCSLDMLEMHRVFKDAEKLFSILNLTIQQANGLPDNVKEYIAELCQTFNPSHLRMIIAEKHPSYNMNTALNHLKSQVLPVKTNANTTPEQHKNFLLELANVLGNIQSNTLNLKVKKIPLNLVQKVFEIDKSEMTLFKLTELIDDVPTLKKKFAYRVLYNTYAESSISHPVTRFESPLLHFNLGLHLMACFSEESISSIYFLGFLHWAMAIKKSLEYPPESTHSILLRIFDAYKVIYSFSHHIAQLLKLTEKFEALGLELDEFICAFKNKKHRQLPPPSYENILAMEKTIESLVVPLGKPIPHESNSQRLDEEKGENLAHAHSKKVPSNSTFAEEEPVSEKLETVSQQINESIDSLSNFIDQNKGTKKKFSHFPGKTSPLDDLFAKLEITTQKLKTTLDLTKATFQRVDKQTNPDISFQDLEKDPKIQAANQLIHQKKWADALKNLTRIETDLSSLQSISPKRQRYELFIKTKRNEIMNNMDMKTYNWLVVNKRWFDVFRAIQFVLDNEKKLPEANRDEVVKEFQLSRKLLHDRIDAENWASWNRWLARDCQSQPTPLFPQLPTQASIHNLKLKARAHMTAKEWIPAFRILDQFERQLAAIPMDEVTHQKHLSFLDSHKKHIEQKANQATLALWQQEKES